ncbi:MAG: hypothetical protein D6692_08585 [Planctomycetota bacterium]|nr:MAG: hypothetical protein D6692_08585 [Planctomycetota bacterium]
MRTATWGLAIAMLAGTASADIWSSGDLGNNVINDAGDFVLNPVLNMPSNSDPATMTVIYGLWNSPDVSVDAFVNGNYVGTFVADQGYISPGPEVAVFDISGLLLDGANTVLFTGNNANDGDYVVGQVDIEFTPVPTPAGVALLGLSGLVAGRRRR